MRADDRVTRPVTTPAPWNFAAPWGGRGQLSDLDGPVHWVEFGATVSAAPVLVFVHGLGGAHLNWALVGLPLAATHRAVALDLRGFGLTPASGRDTSVRANVALLDRFIREVIGEPVILVGNSMGGMISILQGAQHPDVVAGTVLIDPALPAPRQRPDPQVAAQFLRYAVPGVGERYLRHAQRRVSAETQLRQVVELCFADPSHYDTDLFDAGVALAEQRREFPGNAEAFLRAARSLLLINARSGRYEAAMRQVSTPVLLLHGERDRLVPVAAARRAAARNPRWETAYLSGLGHTPQMEAPRAVIAAIEAWLRRHPDLDGSSLS